jgi:hypothetical protein
MRDEREGPSSAAEIELDSLVRLSHTCHILLKWSLRAASSSMVLSLASSAGLLEKALPPGSRPDSSSCEVLVDLQLLAAKGRRAVLLPLGVVGSISLMILGRPLKPPNSSRSLALLSKLELARGARSHLLLLSDGKTAIEFSLDPELSQ